MLGLPINVSSPKRDAPNRCNGQALKVLQGVVPGLAPGVALAMFMNWLVKPRKPPNTIEMNRTL